MNTSGCGQNGPDDFQAEREHYFAEIAELKNQRDELQTQLAECRRENASLRAQLGRDS